MTVSPTASPTAGLSRCFAIAAVSMWPVSHLTVGETVILLTTPSPSASKHLLNGEGGAAEWHFCRRLQSHHAAQGCRVLMKARPQQLATIAPRRPVIAGAFPSRHQLGLFSLTGSACPHCHDPRRARIPAKCHSSPPLHAAPAVSVAAGLSREAAWAGERSAQRTAGVAAHDKGNGPGGTAPPM